MIETAKRFLHQQDATVKSAAESRLDPITGEWTVFAPYRDRRPDEFKVSRSVASETLECPFCQGHEANTPPPVWIGRVDDDEMRIFQPQSTRSLCDADWSVRVVPNKFPAVSSAPGIGGISKNAERDSTFFQSRPTVGGHEVIIESPNHVQSLTELDLAEATLVFKAYQDRILHWRSVPDIRYISVFKNVGGDAGASLRHGHSQLIAIDRQPKLVSTIVDRMQHHRATTGCCLQCDLIRAELKSKRRIVAQTESLIAYCPFASRLPMMVRITTKDHHACYEELSDEMIEAVSRLAVKVISWLEVLHPGTSYNFLLHTRPPASPGGMDPYHWSMELFPRLTKIAGFEWSSQCMINPVLPEQAAAQYRKCAAAEDPRIVL